MKFEKLFKSYGFNKKFLTPERVLMMIECFDVKIIEDKTFHAPFLLVGNRNGKANGNGYSNGKEKILVYNPHISPDELVYSLGHELGHLLLGDYKDLQLKGINQNPKICWKRERDADIIGYLCWIPTNYFFKLDKTVDEEFLLRDLCNCDTDSKFLFKHLPARLRILRAYYRVFDKIKEFEERFKIDSQYLLNFFDEKEGK
jgi:hypothetical protein